MKAVKIIISIILLPTLAISAYAKDIVYKAGRPITYSVKSDGAPVVGLALDMFRGDLKAVLGSDLKESSRPSIVIATLPEGSADPLKARPQGFRIRENDGVLYVEGADDQGTAYGIMELSRMIGVSPWVWWADNPYKKLSKWTVPSSYCTEQSPAVLYRGIFINDEGSGFCPWAWKTHDPSEISGRIGPKTHEQLFQLLLRLRANLFWPAMHGCSVPFYLTEGNKEMALRYNITIGTSHCEPMLCDILGEWGRRGTGEYNFLVNRDNVMDFWEKRVAETVGSNACYTLGMRSTADTGMLGVGDDVKERMAVLSEVLDAQRNLLAKYNGGDPAKVSQVFIPYKEVLPIYNTGLQVPDDVTLMWCDDNYGYIHHFPTESELARSGGNGLYYHLSYCGRPNCTNWISGYSPALVRSELERAYNSGNRRMWVFNVGDLKPHEYLIDFALDLAWNESLLHTEDYTLHLDRFLEREYGEAVAAELKPAVLEYFRLVQHVRPEFMGHTRWEEHSSMYSAVSDLPWSDEFIKAFLARCDSMEACVKSVEGSLPEDMAASLYETIGYNVYSYTAMARKMLGGQLARHGLCDWELSDSGQAEIKKLSEKYHGLLGGKWNYMAGYSGETKFTPLKKVTCEAPAVSPVIASFSASDGKYGPACSVLNELGHSTEALSIPEGECFEFDIPALDKPAYLALRFIPVYPSNKEETLQVTVAIDGEYYETEVLSPVQYHTLGRSEEWKRNIESCQATRLLPLNANTVARHVRITADTPGVILDEIEILEDAR